MRIRRYLKHGRFFILIGSGCSSKIRKEYKNSCRILTEVDTLYINDAGKSYYQTSVIPCANSLLSARTIMTVFIGRNTKEFLKHADKMLIGEITGLFGYGLKRHARIGTKKQRRLRHAKTR